MATDRGKNLHVTGTFNACLELMFHIVHKIGLYPTKLADSVFRSAITCVFELHGEHHFDEAVRRAIEYKPRSFQPSDEELAGLEQARRQQQAPRQPGEKHKGGDMATPASAKKTKKEDANAQPCHGQVYHGTCRKPGCQYDHNAGRCEAYRKKYPDGPPRGDK